MTNFEKYFPGRKIDEISRLRAENAELKQKLEDAKATAYAESVDAGMENRRLKEEHRWRKCSDEMPSNGQEVLVWLTAGGSHGFVLTSTYLDSQWYYGEDPQDCKPSHWMPLPSAPKEQA